MILFTIDHEPFRTTAQQKAVTYRNGRPQFYYPEKLQEAYNAYLNDVWPYKPAEPITGPIALYVTFWFGTSDKKKWFKPKTTRPDTDNLIKGFKDVLTAAGYWKDDAQICREIIAKTWHERGHIDVTILPLNDAKKDAEALRKAMEKF